jgi:hypothetical protein
LARARKLETAARGIRSVMRLAAAVAAVLTACSPGNRVHPDGAGDDTAVDGAVADDACTDAAAQPSNRGCRFWAVDLANAIEVDGPTQNGNCAMYGGDIIALGQLPVCVATDGTFAGRCDLDGTCASGPAGATCQVRDACGLDAQHAPFAIAIANDGSDPADVTLADALGISTTTTLAPGATATLFPQQLGFADHSIAGPGIAAAAYRLTSTRPIVAYQLDPFDDIHAFSEDASVLLPEPTWGVEYIAMAYPNMVRRPAYDDWHGYVTLVAAADTIVTVTPTTDVLAGGATLASGTTATFALHAYDTLQVVAASGDISGTRVTADRPLGAFAGHEATVIADPFPFRNACCADHLEEQLYPTNTWSKTFAIARGRVRATGIHDFVRVVTNAPGTIVQFTPQVSSTCDGVVLSAGQVCDVFITDDLEVRANQPVLVGHYMVSGGGLGPQSGDPALSFVPPVEQFRDRYLVVVPDQFVHSDMNLVAPTGTPVLLDGADISLALTPFASGAWSAARLQVSPGAHTLACPMKCSVEVAGWDTAVSYQYSGGLALAPLVQ